MPKEQTAEKPMTRRYWVCPVNGVTGLFFWSVGVGG
jgi:hypothetical protein